MSGPAAARMVDVRDVTRTYGHGATATAALRGVTFSIDEGKLVALRGRSGSGKTTLLNVIGGPGAPRAAPRPAARPAATPPGDGGRRRPPRGDAGAPLPPLGARPPPVAVRPASARSG